MLKNAKRTQSQPGNPAIMRNEPNFAPPPTLASPKNTKRTQSQHAGRRSVPARRETQSAPAHNPIMQNKPNFPPRPPCPKQKKRNEPNSRIPSVSPPHISAKRTQSQPRRTCGGPNMRNEPNFQQPIYNPMTQSEQANRKPLQHNRLGYVATGDPFSGEIDGEYRIPARRDRMSKMHLISFCPGRGYSERLCPVSGNTGFSSDCFFSCLGGGRFGVQFFF